MATQLGLIPEDMEEVLADQEQWMREEEEEEQRARGQTMAEETQHQQQRRDEDTDVRTAILLLEYARHGARQRQQCRPIRAP